MLATLCGCNEKPSLADDLCEVCWHSVGKHYENGRPSRCDYEVEDA